MFSLLQLILPTKLALLMFMLRFSINELLFIIDLYLIFVISTDLYTVAIGLPHGSFGNNCKLVGILMFLLA